MLKNKRNISIIAIALIVIIGSVYVGCSKTTDMQTIPETNGKSLSVASSEEEPFVIPIIIRKEYYNDFFVENFKKLPSEMYFINSILAGYKSGEIWFNNEHRGKELINNLESISTSYTLSKKKNYTGIINKLEGLVNRIPLTSNEITTKVIEAILSLTIEILQLEKDTQFIAPDYLNTWEDVENFFYSAETNSITLTLIIAIAFFVGGAIAILSATGVATLCNICTHCFESAAKMAENNGTTYNQEVQNCYDSTACEVCGVE